MKLELLKEKEVPILSRKRYIYVLEAEGATPSRLDFLKDIAKKLNVDEKLIVIKHVYPQYGSKNAKVIVNVYKKEEDLKKFEHESLIKRHHKKTKEEIEQEEKERAEKEAEAQRKKQEAEAAKEKLHEEAEEKKEEEPAEEKPGEKVKEEASKEVKSEEKPEEAPKEEEKKE